MLQQQYSIPHHLCLPSRYGKTSIMFILVTFNMCISFCSADYQPLKFTENLLNNATLVYNSTDSILLTCTVPLSTKPTELYWIFNNKKLTSDVVKRVHVPSVIHKDTGYELQLIITSPIPMKDAGTYTCVAENEWERIERHTNIKFDVSHGKHAKN